MISKATISAESPKPAAAPKPPPPPPPVAKPAVAAGAKTASFQPAPMTKPPVNIDPAASTLRSERIGDGQANCLERAYVMARANDQVVLFSDRDGVGHAVVQRPNGTVVDPNLPGMEYPSLRAWQAANPRYFDPVAIPKAKLDQVFQAEPGQARNAVIQKLGLDGVAGRAVADPAMPMPEWMANGQRPPWISNDVWQYGYTEQGRTDLIARYQAAWPQFSAHVEELRPDWMENGTQPPFIPTEAWVHLPTNIQQQILSSARGQFDAAVQDEMALYFGGVPSGGARLDAPFSPALVGGSWGTGQATGSDWARYHTQATVMPSFDQSAQFLDLGAILGSGYPNYHANLCGPLAAFSGMPGVTVHGGLASLDSAFTNFLKTPEGALTNAGDLTHLLQLHGYTVDPTTSFGANAPTPQQLDAMLASGQEVLTLVNINGYNGNSQMTTSPNYMTEDGMLAQMGSDASPHPIAHWVRVMDVETSPVTGQTYVRVYNSFMNREEVYSWNDFQAAWSNTGAGNNPYTYVAGTPP